MRTSPLLEKELLAIQRRINFELLVRGLAFFCVSLLALVLLAVYVMARYNFSEQAVFWTRISLIAGVAYFGWRFLLRRFLYRPSLARIASFLDSRHPELQQSLSTAVELAQPASKIHPELKRLVREDASRKFGRIPQPSLYWPQISTGSMAAVVVALLAGFLLFRSGPAEFGFGLERLLSSWTDDTPVPLYRIDVEPGSVTVAERADLEVRARPEGFEADKVEIHVRYVNSADWESVQMLQGLQESGYLFHFFDIREPLDYFVEADGIRSETFQVSVSDAPRVEGVRFSLHYPAYTGLSELTLENETYIRALKGTFVRATVRTDRPATAARIKFEELPELELTRSGLQAFAGEFTVERDDFFRIFLANAENVVGPGSEEFVIEALSDQEPTLRFTSPGRDKPVTNIEEVFTEVRAEDDFGIRQLSLHFSVNGEAEQEAPLDFVRGSRNLTASQTFYLEEFDLQPGDFVSYYAKAEDAVSSTTTDIFFLEVRPFDREYRQSQMNQGGQAGQQGLELSRQQKQIVVASFSLIQDKDRLAEDEFVENSQTLALIQQRLQGQAQVIIDRIERRGVEQIDVRFAKMLESMKEALSHMKPAEEALSGVDPESALPEAQKALQHLLRAEALFNEVQVAMSSSSESAASPEELADLVDLELDRTKNQYETLQQNRQAERDQAIDEALEKLKELARRQEQAAEKQRRQAASGSSGNSSQQDLADELERLARELARLSRQQNQENLSRVSQELNRAARDLREAANSNASPGRSNELARQASDRLRRAQEALARQRRSQVENQLDELQAEARQLSERQRDVLEGLSSMQPPEPNQPPGDDFMDNLRELYWEKQDMQEDLQGLEGRLHQSARRIQGEEPEAARKLKEAAVAIRDERLPDKMREGSDLLANGLISLARLREEGAAQDLESLEEKIGEARQALGRSGGNQEDRLKQALQEAGSLAEKLESLKDRLASMQRRTEEAGHPEGREGQTAEPSGSAESEGEQAQQGQPSESASGQESQQASSESGQGRQGRAAQQAGVAGGYSSSGIDPGNIQREWAARIREAEELRRSLNGLDPSLGREAARLTQQMMQANLGEILDDPGEVENLKSALIDGFHELELAISRALGQNAEQGLRPVEDEETPPEFRERVEEYYRRLATEASRRESP